MQPYPFAIDIALCSLEKIQYLKFSFRNIKVLRISKVQFLVKKEKVLNDILRAFMIGECDTKIG